MTEKSVADSLDKDYEVAFDMLIPGNQKITSHQITVQAGDPIEAIARAIDEWILRTDPTKATIRIKEIQEQKKGGLA